MFHRTELRAVAIAALVAFGATGIASASSSGPPATVTATALPHSDSGSMYAHRGRVVRSSKLEVRVFVNARDGFALASVGQAQYPASTTNGGRTWRIDGPHFHVNAANAPDVVTEVTAIEPHTYAAYGGGQSVVVSTDAGRHWWRAYFPGAPIAVESTAGTGTKPSLAAIVEENPGKFAAYVSSDGGRRWHLAHSFV